jgi:uncharacterized membrane protein YdjX (TVP38/TMEM64 family)
MMSRQILRRERILRDRRAQQKGSKGSCGRAVIVLLAITALAVALPVLVRALGGAQQLRALVEGAGPWAPLAYVAAKAATSLMAPLLGTPLKAVAGTLFGLRDGIAYSVLGDVLGGCASFWISRSLGRRAVARLVGEGNVDRVDELSGRLGEWRALLLARLLLSSVYNLVSFAAGLSRRLPFWQYLAVTTLGGVFHTGFLVALGASATLDRRALLAAYGALAVLALLAVLGRRRLRRAARGWLGNGSERDRPEDDDRRSPEAEKRTKDPGGRC